MIYNIILAAFLFCGVILILLILLRKGEAGGLSSAFGGMGGDPGLLGVKAQQQLDKIITYVAILFIFSAILLNTPGLRKRGVVDENNATQQNQETPGEGK